MKKKFTFRKYEPRYIKNDSLKLSLNRSNINIGRKAYIELGSPEKIDIYYDVENNAIKLKPSDNGKKINSNNLVISAGSLSKIMLKGRYDYLENGIFKFRSPKGGTCLKNTN